MSKRGWGQGRGGDGVGVGGVWGGEGAEGAPRQGGWSIVLSLELLRSFCQSFKTPKVVPPRLRVSETFSEF